MGETAAVCDVLVLGGGPAGSAAAIRCAQAGLHVVLLEAKAFPRHRPGETLHPGVEPVLRQLGVFGAVVAADFLRHEGNWIEWAAPPRFEAFGRGAHGPWRGFQAWRATFDALLLDRARAVGVQIHQPARATAVIAREGRVTGVHTPAGPINARWVIDAGGGSHWLARQLSLPIAKYSPPLFARYGYARGRCPACDEAPSISADPTGWTWIARVQSDVYQWTRLDFGLASRPKDWRPELLEGLTSDGPCRAADVTWRKVGRVAGPGFFLVGDAAASLDPAASHGVLKALMSGMMAAHVICALATGSGEAELRALLGYDRWLSAWFDADLAKLRALYATLGVAFDSVTSSSSDPRPAPA